MKNVLFNSEDIQNKVAQMSVQIDRKHTEDDDVVMICVLNGGFMFFSDLVKYMGKDVEIDFIRAKSYNGQDQGVVHILKDIETNIEGKHVYVVDDFYDTGSTLDRILEHLSTLNPKSPNYIAKQIGDMYKTVGVDGAVAINGEYANSSKYVYVDSVAVKTPDYFDNNGVAKSAYTPYFAAGLAGTSGSEYGTFKGATGTLFNSVPAAFGSVVPTATESQGIDPSDSNAYALAKLTLGNRDEYKFNVLLTPGIYNSIHSTE